MFKNEAMQNEIRREDRRVNRTRRSLATALVELIKEKHFDAITVQDLIDRAGVGRSTFYLHFRDKEDLFRKDWQHFLDALVSHVDWDGLSGRFFPAVHLFAHLQEVRPFYRGLVRSRKTESVFKTGVEYLSQGLEKSLACWLTNKPASLIPTPIVANYLAGQLFGLLRWWLDQDMPYSPERMDEIFHQLVAPGLRAALAIPQKTDGAREYLRTGT